jgi:toxin-antitoxin system PIN domain toxin
VTPDVNVLVAAFRPDHGDHRRARKWLDQALRDSAAGGRVSILPMVAASFVRLVTNPRVFMRADPVDEALAFVQQLLAAPGVEMPPVAAEWPILRSLCARLGLAGNDIPDAWIATAVLHLGGHLVTFDRGFKRLLPKADLTVLDPASEKS